jgi:DNA-binding MarR family transcriptional regulator
VLAEGGGRSKQAVGKRIQELEAAGLVTVEPDPTDGRATIVRRTPEGDRVLRAVLDQIADLEAELRAQVGARRYETFRSVLDELAGDYLPPALYQTGRRHAMRERA